MAISGFFLMMVLYGAMYTFPALTTAMASDLGTTRTTLQGAFAIWGLTVAACGPVSGRLVDRYGLRPALIAGSLGLVIALLGLGLAQASWQVYVVLVLFGAPAHMLLSLSAIVAASRQGARKRGGALGMTGAGIGVGMTLLIPGAVWLSTIIGWRGALFALAGIAILVSLLVIALMPRPTALPASENAAVAWYQLLRSRPFIVLFIGGIGVGLMDEAIYQHLVPHLSATGVALGLAGIILGVLSLGYTLGQVAGGWLSDRWGRWPIGGAAAVLLGLALLVIALVPLQGVALVLTALSAGLGLGATIAIRSATLGDLFNGPSLGVVTGAYQWAYALGGSTIGWAGAYVYEHAGSYTPVFLVGVGTAVLWAVCLKVVVAIHKAQPTHASTVAEGAEPLRALNR
jgi:MFS family permease